MSEIIIYVDDFHLWHLPASKIDRSVLIQKALDAYWEKRNKK